MDFISGLWAAKRLSCVRETMETIFWIMGQTILTGTYDHRSVRTGHPVRSAIHKH
jgi:hypothetical protein